MKRNNRRSGGFTLIELLVVVLILGILLAIAIPAYLSSMKSSRANTARSNARIIATSVQAAYVKDGGKDYSSYNAGAIGVDPILTDLGGKVPDNPCSAAAGVAGYTITPGTAPSHVWKILANNADGLCDADATLEDPGTPTNDWSVQLKG